MDEKTLNEKFFEFLILHQLYLMRFDASVRNKVLSLLNKTETDLVVQLARLENIKGQLTPTENRKLKKLMEEIKKIRAPIFEEILDLWRNEFTEMVKAEPKFLAEALKNFSPAELEIILPAAVGLRSIVNNSAFQGKVLRDWAKNLAAVDLQRIEQQIRIGLTQGENTKQISQRVVGSVRLRGSDGVTSLTRRDAFSITRTAINHLGNAARREFFKENSQIFSEELYVATLDSRTTAICRSLDGKKFPIGQGPLPPLHFNCRSLRVAVVSEEAIGERPAKPFTKKQILKEFTDEKGLGNITDRADLPKGMKGQFDDFLKMRMRQLTGQVPSKVTYAQWLKGLSVETQNEILGKTKAQLFRKGELELDQFVNRKGDELTLKQLATLHKENFIKAGFNPTDFL